MAWSIRIGSLMLPPSEKRSATMKAIKSKDTAPEMQVRRFVHSLGYRYRLYLETLPGKPDLVFPRLKKVIFIHGCFWHGHSCT
jgi:DNA mismatch endonuclease, patch repair protein